MDKKKQERLEAKGWKIGSVEKFLGLTPEENALIEIKLALSRNLKLHTANNYDTIRASSENSVQPT